MLDTCICSFIMREHPIEVLQKLQQISDQQHRIVISAITYSEMRYGAINKKASPKLWDQVTDFTGRLDEIVPWNAPAVDATAKLKRELNGEGTPIGNNDSAIAGHAIATGSILVTNNMREFSRVPGLEVEDWVH